jgi:hypothetical protein
MAHHPSPSSAQHAQTVETTLTTETVSNQPALTVHQSEVAQSLSNALNSGELTVTISELLGCDYVFIKYPANTSLMYERHITQTINQLISVLGLTPGQKIFIGAHEDEAGEACFARFNCEWQGFTATQVTSTAIANNEQADFMRMIFDCSSPYEQEAL